MLKPRALRPGDRIALVAPASPFPARSFDAGVAELRRLGYEPVYDESVFARQRYIAGDAALRADSVPPRLGRSVDRRADRGPRRLRQRPAAAAARRRRRSARTPKAFIGYSDNTSLLAWLTGQCGVVAFHGPMLEGRLAKGRPAYDRDTFTRVLTRAAPAGRDRASAGRGAAPGRGAPACCVGGTLTQLLASLGTPYAFDPPAGHVLFIDEVAERPYRIDRMLTQLRLAGTAVARVGDRLRRAAALRRAGDGGPGDQAPSSPNCSRSSRAGAVRPAVGSHRRRLHDAAVRRPRARRRRPGAGALIIEEAAVGMTHEANPPDWRVRHRDGDAGGDAQEPRLRRPRLRPERLSADERLPGGAADHDAPGLQAGAHHAPISTSSSSATPSRAATPSSRKCSTGRSAIARCPRRSAITSSGARAPSSSPARTARRRPRR